MKVHSSLYDTKYQQFDKKSVTITIDKDLNQYITIFSYGSCVFFNIPKGELLVLARAMCMMKLRLNCSNWPTFITTMIRKWE